jgi:hypothetical protein
MTRSDEVQRPKGLSTGERSIGDYRPLVWDRARNIGKPTRPAEA